MATAPASAQAPAAPAPVDYSNASNWICLPGRADICSTPLGTTALNPNGYGSVGQSIVAKNPPLDCFYVYPTVSRDSGMNSDLVVDASERGAAQVQFARFAGVCRTFAPVYRQMTLGAVAAAAAGADMTRPAFDRLFGRRERLAHLSRALQQGPPVRSHRAQPGLADAAAAHQERDRGQADRASRCAARSCPATIVSCRRAGASAARSSRTPVCASPGETGCVMSWVSFRENNVPPAGAIFGDRAAAGDDGRLHQPGAAGLRRLGTARQLLECALVASGARRADPMVDRRRAVDAVRPHRRPGVGRCVNDGQRGYLSVRINADPKDKRTDRVYGEVGMLGMFVPGWGMHLADVAAAQGDLIRQRRGGWPRSSDRLPHTLSRRLRRTRAPLRLDRLFRGHGHGRASFITPII